MFSSSWEQVPEELAENSGRLPGRGVTSSFFETRKTVEMRGWEEGARKDIEKMLALLVLHPWEVKVREARGAGGVRMAGRDGSTMMLAPHGQGGHGW